MNHKEQLDVISQTLHKIRSTLHAKSYEHLPRFVIAKEDVWAMMPMEVAVWGQLKEEV